VTTLQELKKKRTAVHTPYRFGCSHPVSGRQWRERVNDASRTWRVRTTWLF